MDIPCCIKVTHYASDGEMIEDWQDTTLSLSDDAIIELVDRYFEIKKKRAILDE